MKKFVKLSEVKGNNELNKEELGSVKAGATYLYGVPIYCYGVPNDDDYYKKLVQLA